MSRESIRARIDAANATLARLEIQRGSQRLAIQHAREDCAAMGHTWARKGDGDSVECTTCLEKGEGWYCPTAPALVCVYEESDTLHDHCIHCGEPEERK